MSLALASMAVRVAGRGAGTDREGNIARAGSVGREGRREGRGGGSRRRDAHRRDGEPKRRTSDRTGRRERHERVESE